MFFQYQPKLFNMVVRQTWVLAYKISIDVKFGNVIASPNISKY